VLKLKHLGFAVLRLAAERTVKEIRGMAANADSACAIKWSAGAQKAMELRPIGVVKSRWVVQNL